MAEGAGEGGCEDCGEWGPGGGAEDDGSVVRIVSLTPGLSGAGSGAWNRWGRTTDLSMMVTTGAMSVEAQKAAMRSDVTRHGREVLLYCEAIVRLGGKDCGLAVKLESGVTTAAKEGRPCEQSEEGETSKLHTVVQICATAVRQVQLLIVC